MFRYPITITIDTNNFDSVKYDLSEDSKLQVLLKQVKDNKVKVVLSDVVLKEAKAHLEKCSKALYSQIRKNRNQLLEISNENLINTVGLENYIEIPDKNTIVESANEKFNKYISDLNAEVLDISMIDINEIIDDYFEIRAPFQNGEKKRKEFPDAFIVNQIKQRFPDENSLIILSNDTGFVNGCRRYKNYKVINSLDDLLKQISKQDEQYELAIEALKNLGDKINESIEEYVKEKEDIVVDGQTVDKDGIIEGHEYSETYLHNISNVSHMLHIIDDIEDDVALITLECKANIEMDCYYENNDNVHWNSENDEYTFVETVHLYEKYCPRFACRIKINLKNSEVDILPLRILIGNSSKTESIVIDDREYDYDTDYFINEERENLGLQRLSDYYDYVEEELLDSEFNKDIVEILSEYNKTAYKLEEVGLNIESLLTKFEKMSNDQKHRLLKRLDEELSYFEFCNIEKPLIFNETSIKKWLCDLYEVVDNVYEELETPDNMELGHNYRIIGINDGLNISIDSMPKVDYSEGDEECVDIDALTDNGETAKGMIKVVVGYMHFDEEGCATDGIEDEVSFDYNAIKKLVDDFVEEQKAAINECEKLVEVFNNISVAFNG